MFSLASHFLTSFADAAAACNKGSFFGLPHWWQYLPSKEFLPGCNINAQIPDDIWPIGLAVLEIMLRLAGMIAVFSIIYAGISFITAAGSPEKTTAARNRIINSLIGLGIVMVAASAVAFIGGHLSK